MKKIFFSLVSLCLAVSTVAQMTLQPNIYQSPEVSSLMKEVLSPVSLSSGTVNVNIPLYTLQKGSISVPISLNYDASGVKVDAQPGWVGQNWSLSSGGMISRVVKGIPDETYFTEKIDILISGGNIPLQTYSVGYLHNNHRLSTTQWEKDTEIDNWAKNGYYELEPDEFVFNFCGHSGVFYINENDQIVVKGQKGWKIQPLVLMNLPVYDGRVPFNINDGRSYTYMRYNMYANYPGFVRWTADRIMGFKVTDPNGIEYYFGQFEEVDNGTFNWYTSSLEGIEINADFFAEIFFEQFNAWHLRKIKAPNGDEVTFKYEHFWPTLSLSRNYSYNYMSGQSRGFGWLFGGKVSTTIWQAGPSWNGDILRPVYLTEIRTNDHLVTFTSSQTSDLQYNSTMVNSWLYTLNNNYADRYLYVPVFYGQQPIRVWTSAGMFIEHVSGARYNMNYGDVRKKKLDRIQVKSLITNEITKDYTFNYNQSTSTRLQLASLRENTLPAYQFTYNTTSLPGYLSDQHDHWGYFNNRTPSYSIPTLSTFHTYREPNFTYMQAGSLTQIKYPTGGLKKLVYEPHYYTRRVIRNATNGNLSLETVTQSIGGGLRIKEVHETDNSNVLLKKTFTYSPGILNGKPEYYWGGYQGKLTNGNTYTADRFYSQSLLPVSNNPAGGSVSYTTATEILEGNGKIEYTFANHDTRMDENSKGSIDLQKSIYYPLTSKDLERGMITEIKYYAEGSSTSSKREQFIYYTQGSTEFVKAVYLRRLSLFGGLEVNAVEGTAYRNYVSPYNLMRKAEYYTYPGNITKFMDRTYDYTNLNHLRGETLYDQVQNISTSYKYPYDYSTSVYQNMVARNILTPVIETTVNKGSTATEKTTVNYSSYTGTSGTLYRPSTVIKTSSRIGSTITDQLIFTNYDRKGNLVAGRDWDGQQKVYIWGYNGAYIVAEVTGVALSSVTSANSSLSGIATNPLTGALPAAAETALRNLSNARVVTYDYKPLVGISRITDVSGRVTTFNYDSEGRLSTIVDSNGHVVERYDYNYKQ